MSASGQSERPLEVEDLAIRARPPLPKRLSRFALLGGAGIFAACVLAALFAGLSEQPDRRHEEAAATQAAGPPTTIDAAPSGYGADMFARPREAELDESLFEENVGPQSGAVVPRADPPPPTAAGESASAPPAPIVYARQRQDIPTNAWRLEERLTAPRSAYELMAGHIIPAALMSELNSELPGRVIAQVTAPVYDSVSGRHLLIPPGARLVGRYDGGIAHGQERLHLVWTRLILPDAASIDLGEMDAGDASGASGIADRVDRRLGRLAGAAFISAILGVGANAAEDRNDGDRVSETIAQSAAQEAARSGGRIVDRELALRPRIVIRAGAPVRVLVSRDVSLRPYRGD